MAASQETMRRNSGERGHTKYFTLTIGFAAWDAKMNVRNVRINSIKSPWADPSSNYERLHSLNAAQSRGRQPPCTSCDARKRVKCKQISLLLTAACPCIRLCSGSLSQFDRLLTLPRCVPRFKPSYCLSFTAVIWRRRKFSVPGVPLQTWPKQQAVIMFLIDWRRLIALDADVFKSSACIW